MKISHSLTLTTGLCLSQSEILMEKEFSMQLRMLYWQRVLQKENGGCSTIHFSLKHTSGDLNNMCVVIPAFLSIL